MHKDVEELMHIQQDFKSALNKTLTVIEDMNKEEDELKQFVIDSMKLLALDILPKLAKNIEDVKSFSTETFDKDKYDAYYKEFKDLFNLFDNKFNTFTKFFK